MTQHRRIGVLAIAFAFSVLGTASGLLAADHVLFDFEDGATAWRPTVFKNATGTIKAKRASEAKVGAGAIEVRIDDLTAPYGKLRSPTLPFGQPWRQRKYDRIRFWARAERPMTRAHLQFRTDEGQSFTFHFVMDKAEWQQHEFPVTRGWNRYKKALDLSRVSWVDVGAVGTAHFMLDHLELLEAAREVFLQSDRHLFVAPTRQPPRIDGDLGDRCWKTASPLSRFTRYKSDEPARDQTEAWITYDEAALYIAARLHSRAMDKLKTSAKARDASVWKDDCLEVFVDPRHTHKEWFQFVTNSIGTQYDGLFPPGEAPGRGLAWNGEWTVEVAVGKSSWTVEMRVPFADLGRVPQPGEAWGFNICREAHSTGELSYWAPTGGKFTRARGFADLVFAPVLDLSAKFSDARVEEKTPGAYVFRAKTEARRPVTGRYRLRMQSPEDRITHAQGRIAIPAGESETVIPVEFEIQNAGEAKVCLLLTDEKTRAVLSYGAHNFQVTFPSEASLSKIVLVPTPKEFTQGKGAFGLQAETRIRTGSGGRETFIADVVRRELAKYHGIELPKASRTAAGDGLILIGRPDTCPPLRSALAEHGILKRFDALKSEGYVVLVEPKRVLIAGKDARGTYYAARTFLQLVAGATMEGQPPRAPHCAIVDWPDFPFRAYMVSTCGFSQGPVPADVLKEHIYKEIAGYKYNCILWRVKNGYDYQGRPGIARASALPRDTYKELVRFAEDHFLDLMPSLNLHGHANWFLGPYPELREDGDIKTLCTRHPDTYPLLFDMTDQLIELFNRPKRFHVGLDEVRWQTPNLPPDKHCPRCKGIPKWQIFADHVTRLRDHLKSRGVETWMWGDMLVRRHNGRAPFDCYKALDLIPKDVVLTNWSAGSAPGSCRELHEKGFPVVRGNSIEVPSVDAPHVFGNLASIWQCTPWRSVCGVGEWGVMMTTAYAANFSWNVNREHITQDRFIRESDANILRLIARPAVPNGGASYVPIDIGKVVNRRVVDRASGDGKGWADLGPDLDLRALPMGRIQLGPMLFQTVPGEPTAARCIYLTERVPSSRPIPVGKPAASLVFLHAAILPKSSSGRAALFRRFIRPPDGVPIATCRVTYDDGNQVNVPLRLGVEVGSWLPSRKSEYLRRCPYLFRLATQKARRTIGPDAADVVLCAFEWPNATGRSVHSVELMHAGTEADYALVALSLRSTRQP